MTTQKVRAYKNWEKEFNDGLSEWFWTEVVGKAIVVGIAISLPMFGFGAMTAPQGVNRVNAGVEATVKGHDFLWTHAIKAGGAAVDAVAPLIENK